MINLEIKVILKNYDKVDDDHYISSVETTYERYKIPLVRVITWQNQCIQNVICVEEVWEIGW